MDRRTLILRHGRENLKKCSLRGLETRRDLIFLTYPQDKIETLADTVVLKVGAPPLAQEDAPYRLLLLDATWRLAPIMERSLPPGGIFRSLPSHFRTAYPRRQTGCPNPELGLASIEALYLAYLILGRETAGLLDSYYWKETFIQSLALSSLKTP